MSPTHGSERTIASREIVLDAEDVRALPRRLLTGQPGVTVRTLWEDAGDHSAAGVMRLEPGARVAPHTHRYSVHHVWVFAGQCLVGGRSLSPGAYCFIPAGVPHAIDGTGPEGCSLFYLYLRADID